MNSLIKKNNVKILGDGDRVLLFVHGYGCNQKMWRFVTPEFEYDYKVILIDLVGYGESDVDAFDKAKYSSLKGYASDIIELCEELELKDITLIGHSVSSMIGLHVSIMAPELINKLIMIGPSPCYIDQDNYTGGFSKEDIDELIDTINSNYLGWSSAITPVIMGNPDKPELTAELKNSFCQTDPEIAKQFAEVTFKGDERKYLDQCFAKTLIIQSKTDIIAPIEVGSYMHKNLVNSKLKILDTNGHCPHMSAPRETIEAIKEYLDAK
jgi:sigma-B regulation protein RsbQ